MSEDDQLPDARFPDPVSVKSEDWSRVSENDDWEVGNPTNAKTPAEESKPRFLRTGADLWFIYLNKVLVTEDTARSVEQFGYGVVVERRTNHCFDQIGEAEIVAVDLSRTEAEEWMTEFMHHHRTQDALDRVVRDE